MRTCSNDLRHHGLRTALALRQLVVLEVPLLQALGLVDVDGLGAELAPADVAVDGGRWRSCPGWIRREMCEVNGVL